MHSAVLKGFLPVNKASEIRGLSRSKRDKSKSVFTIQLPLTCTSVLPQTISGEEWIN